MKTNLKTIKTILELSILKEDFDGIAQAILDFEAELRLMIPYKTSTWHESYKQLIQEILGENSQAEFHVNVD